jgi:hypothetical protein
MTIPLGRQPLTEAELEGFEYHGCSSGTSMAPMVRDAIVRACAEIRRWRAVRGNLEAIAFKTSHCPACGVTNVVSGGHDLLCPLVELWPYGPAAVHEDCCRLHKTAGHGYCNCKASAADDDEYGMVP